MGVVVLLFFPSVVVLPFLFILPFTGHAMMLTYFVSPYDLLDLKNKISKPLSADSVDVGFSVTVSMESSCAHKLQITTLVTVSVNPSGKK